MRFPALSLLIFIPSLFSNEVGVNSPSETSFRSDASNCLIELRKVLTVTQSLDNFVGLGWDNLRNIETRPVLLHTFNECQTTPEGSYLLPDNVIAIPVQQTQFDQMATFHESYESYFQSTTDSINVDASFGYAAFGASGSFSYKHQTTKKEMATTSSNVFVTKVKTHAFALVANADAGLSPGFKHRVLHIASHLRNNLTLQAMYEAQLLIRDYGTHVVTRAEVGASTEQMVFVAREVEFKEKTSLDEMKATAAASFQGLYRGSGSISVGHTVTVEMQKRLSSMTRHVRVNTEGGPSAQRLFSCRPDSNNTCDIAMDNLVALDRQGDPLFSLVSPHLFKELVTSEIYELAEVIQTATTEYYKRNEIPGCTIFGDVNFSFQANVNDSSCNGTVPVTPYGGVYQMCEPLSTNGIMCPEHRCDQFIQKNTITGGFSCPADFEAVPILDFIYHGLEDRPDQICWRECYREFLWKRCFTKCQAVIYKDRIRLRSYSCAPTPPVANVTRDPGYLFGGLYSNGSRNLFTRAESCPAYYFPARIAGDVFVCLSRDRELGKLYAVPFNGIFSCQSPAAKQKCPPHYSAHLATIQGGCEVYYCVMTGIMRHFELPLIKRPPYIPSSVILSNVSTHYVKYFENNELLISYPLDYVINDTIEDPLERQQHFRAANTQNINELVSKWIERKKEEMEEAPHERIGNTTTILGVIVGGIIAVAVLVPAAIFAVRRWRRRDPGLLSYNNDVGDGDL